MTKLLLTFSLMTISLTAFADEAPFTCKEGIDLVISLSSDESRLNSVAEHWLGEADKQDLSPGAQLAYKNRGQALANAAIGKANQLAEARQRTLELCGIPEEKSDESALDVEKSE
jgi:hypothetical protein